MEESVVRIKSGVCRSAMMESVWYKGPKYVNESVGGFRKQSGKETKRISCYGKSQFI